MIKRDGGIATRETRGILTEAALELNDISLGRVEVSNASIIAAAPTQVVDVAGIASDKVIAILAPKKRKLCAERAFSVDTQGVDIKSRAFKHGDSLAPLNILHPAN